MIRMLLAALLAVAAPATAATYRVTPANFVATVNAAVAGDIVVADPALPAGTVFPGWTHSAKVYVGAPLELRLGNATFGPIIGDLTNVIMRGGTIDAGPARNAIAGKFTDVKFLGNKIRNGDTAFAAKFVNVYIENIDFSGTRSDALHSSLIDGLEINGLHCHDSNPGAGAHPDCYQMQSGGAYQLKNIKIRNVHIIGKTQGLNNFGSDYAMSANIDIDGVYVYIEESRGLSFTHCQDCSIRNVVGVRSPTAKFKVTFDPRDMAQAVANGFVGNTVVQNVVANNQPPAGYVPPPFVPSPERYPLTPTVPSVPVPLATPIKRGASIAVAVALKADASVVEVSGDTAAWAARLAATGPFDVLVTPGAGGRVYRLVAVAGQRLTFAVPVRSLYIRTGSTIVAR